MPKQREKILLSWSGGKDSAMTLWELSRSAEFEVCGLIAAVTEDEHRVTTHGTCAELVSAQAESMGLPLDLVFVPKGASNDVFLERLYAALEPHRARGITKVAFGDLYLDEIRDFREESLERIGMQALFPLWHRDTKELCYAFINAKFKAVITCVNGDALEEDFAGRYYDRNLLSDLPLTVDPCGENGEFHTFVYDGPLFTYAVPYKVAGTSTHDKVTYCDLIKKALTRKVASKSKRA